MTGDWTAKEFLAAAAALGDMVVLFERMIDTKPAEAWTWNEGYNDGRIADMGWLAKTAAHYAHEAERLKDAKKRTRQMRVEVIR